MRSMLVRGAVICALLLPASLGHANPPGVRDADRAIHAAELAGRRLLMLLDRSRRAHDVARIACVDQRLTQVNSFGRILGERREQLVAARSRGDRAEVVHLTRVIRTMSRQIRIFEREGRECVFPGAGAADRTVVTVTVDPSIRHQDLSIPPARP